ncbi:MAG: thiamine pyrophosphate-binding protein [Candidatus Omnitrophica bacterium]|nr:thiamine pyrophosphate-binding protein [Candidatus Omnitrophota bacterium]MBU4590167.1 thiamine pyrophosphate-binding protein [Candidatus Omnitrophota bacterium]
MAKLSDYVFSFIARLGVRHVFAVCGGNAMHLVDSLGRNEKLSYIATHHEQAAAMAAEAYARISGKPGAALVTSGPGSTNTITGVCGAWIDSIPTIFISGQVVSNNLIRDTGLRQFGIQEADIVSLVKPITKYAVTVTDPNTIKYHLQKAAYLATSGRPGPVWLDIPLDIQSKLININGLVSFTPDEIKQEKKHALLKKQVGGCIKLLKKAKRPVVISGYGIRLAKGEKEFIRLVEKLKIPVISSWTTSDLIPFDHKFYIGRSGIMGDRAGNFTVQNSDLLLIIGSRMSIPQVGYNYKVFAREAKRIMVDIDKRETEKASMKPGISINADAGEFMIEMLQQLEEKKIALEVDDWLQRCCQWKIRYPVALPEYKDNKETVNSFYFIEVLSEKLGGDAVIVTDMGTSFTCTMQAFRIKKGQRLFTSSGHAPMGFGLPGSIGACFANNRRKTICISGDGGLQMNIQELQTLVHYNLPIILFVLNNGGYLTIKLMQQNHFGRYVGSDKNSGLSCPDIIKVAKAYGIRTEKIANHAELHAKIDSVLAEPGPFICEIIMSETQPLIPRVSSVKKPDGTIISKPLEDLYPFLDREEFLKNMIVKPTEVLE